MKGFEHLWRLPPVALFLASTDVYVWRAPLDLTDSDIQRLQCPLSSDEVQRARRFYFPRHRRRFTVTRGGLRRILSLYVGMNRSNCAFAIVPMGNQPWSAPQARCASASMCPTLMNSPFMP